MATTLLLDDNSPGDTTTGETAETNTPTGTTCGDYSATVAATAAILTGTSRNVTAYRFVSRWGAGVALTPTCVSASAGVDIGEAATVSSSISVLLQYSTDNGVNWTTADTLSLTPPTLGVNTLNYVSYDTTRTLGTPATACCWRLVMEQDWVINDANNTMVLTIYLSDFRLTNTDTGTPCSTSDLVVDKVADVATAQVGDTVTFTVTVTNNGPDAVTSASLTDTLPTSGYTVVSATPSQGSYASGVWTIGTLAVSASATLVIVGTVDAIGTVTNAAAITSSTPPDPDESNNSDSASVDVSAASGGGSGGGGTTNLAGDCQVTWGRAAAVGNPTYALVSTCVEQTWNPVSCFDNPVYSSVTWDSTIITFDQTDITWDAT